MNERIKVDELLDVAEEFEFELEEKQSWWKIGDSRGLRIYVKKPGRNGLATEVNFSGFRVDDDLVRPMTGEEAQAKHRGNVRGIIEPATFASAERDEIIRVFRLGLDQLVESAHAALPRSRERQAAPLPPVESVAIDDRLFGFQGYGRIDAPLWLLGIEEGFGGRLSNPDWSVQRELDVRTEWGAVQDTHEAGLELSDYYWERRNYSRVWRNAAKLARAIVGRASDWLDTDRAHEYVVSSLGRLAGDTFLGELFPLPAVGLEHWPYGSRWINRESYRAVLWPSRRDLWRSVLAHSPTKLIICYGTDVRRYACDLFGCAVRSGIYVHLDRERRIIFAPFIGGRTSNEVLKAVVDAALC